LHLKKIPIYFLQKQTDIVCIGLTYLIEGTIHMKESLKIGLIAILAVWIAKKLPVIKDQL